MAQPVWRESVSLEAAADADVHRWSGTAAGVRERGESNACAVGGTAARDRYSNVAGREQVAAGAATSGGKPGSGDGGRRGRFVNHVLDRGNIHEVHTVDRFSD